MSPAYKIPLTTLGILALIALLTFAAGSLAVLIWIYAIFAVPLGALFTLGALIAFFINKEDREVTYGVLLTGALLLLTGFFLWVAVPFGR